MDGVEVGVDATACGGDGVADVERDQEGEEGDGDDEEERVHGGLALIDEGPVGGVDDEGDWDEEGVDVLAAGGDERQHADG